MRRSRLASSSQDVVDGLRQYRSEVIVNGVADMLHIGVQVRWKKFSVATPLLRDPQRGPRSDATGSGTSSNRSGGSVPGHGLRPGHHRHSGRRQLPPVTLGFLPWTHNARCHRSRSDHSVVTDLRHIDPQQDSGRPRAAREAGLSAERVTRRRGSDHTRQNAVATLSMTTMHLSADTGSRTLRSGHRTPARELPSLSATKARLLLNDSPGVGLNVTHPNLAADDGQPSSTRPRMRRTCAHHEQPMADQYQSARAADGSGHHTSSRTSGVGWRADCADSSQSRRQSREATAAAAARCGAACSSRRPTAVRRQPAGPRAYVLPCVTSVILRRLDDLPIRQRRKPQRQPSCRMTVLTSL